MTVRALQRPQLFTLFGRSGFFGSDSIDEDLPVTVDPRATLPRVSAILLAATVPVVALTGSSQVGGGFAFRDIVGLLIGYSLISAFLIRIPWTRFPPDWSWALIAAQLLFVVSLTTMTGGGASLYFGLYAPTLAIAGWHLRSGAFVLVVSATIILETWRAVGVDTTGSYEQVTIALPFFAALGAASMFIARRLTAALVAVRNDQRCTADTLDAVYHLASDLGADPLQQVAIAARRAFGGRTSAIAIEPAVDARRRISGLHIDGRLTVPITGATTTYGLLTVWRHGSFTSTERRLLAILANTGGRAMDAHRSFTEARGASERDALTGLRNRRSLDTDIETWMEPALANGESITMAFIDIDGLKAINDVHGHQVGDQLICRAGHAISSAVRGEDRVYRVGGDEFVVVALGLPATESRKLRERLSRTNGGDRRERDQGPSDWHLSVGIARGSGLTVNPADLLSKADREMYLAKASAGRRGPLSR